MSSPAQLMLCSQRDFCVQFLGRSSIIWRFGLAMHLGKLFNVLHMDWFEALAGKPFMIDLIKDVYSCK